MQDRRHRPGDVLDDYCPRERRITDHAIVAMIDDEIRRTRCGVCDAEHEYKEAKVPAPRRKTQPPGLFNQVLEGMNGPVPKPHPATAEAEPGIDASVDDEPIAVAAVQDDPVEPQPVRATETVAPPELAEPAESEEPAEPADGGFRRSLIRATFPRPEGQAPADRKMPEFTIQSLHNRRNGGQREAGGQNKFRGRRRPAGGGSQDHLGPMRFRDHGHGQSNSGQGQGQGQGGGRRRRGGKKNR
jgi:hypothetical protein